jgi:hypothetical protein
MPITEGRGVPVLSRRSSGMLSIVDDLVVETTLADEWAYARL